MSWLFFLDELANDKAMLLSFAALLIVVIATAIICIIFVIIPVFRWMFKSKKSKSGEKEPVKTALKKAAEAKVAYTAEEEIEDEEVDRSEVVLVGLGPQEIKVEFARGEDGEDWNAYIIIGDHRSKVRGIDCTASLKESMLKTLLHLEVKQI